jgi:hypothetical protein
MRWTRSIAITYASTWVLASAAAQLRDRPVQPMQPVALTAPTLLFPPDDPAGERCIEPDVLEGIKFLWRTPGEAAPDGGALASYVEIRRFDPDAQAWRPWLKQYASPPFAMAARPRVYDSTFAWRVWTVDRSGITQPYATPSEAHTFCTAAAPKG